MDPTDGRCGAVAVVKEYIDLKNGIMELKTSEGGRGAVVLFSAGQMWVPNRLAYQSLILGYYFNNIFLPQET